MLLSDALPLAEKYLSLLSPGCVRIETVGSVKRQDSFEVHDLEFLIIPDENRAPLEFGKKIPQINFYKVLNDLESRGLLRFVKGASRQRQYQLTEVNSLNPFILELWIVNPLTWGIQNVIRTGPTLFSHCYVMNRSLTYWDEKTNRRYRGLLPDDLKYIRGETKIMSGDAVLSLPEEKDALALIGHGWVEPKKRRELLRW